MKTAGQRKMVDSVLHKPLFIHTGSIFASIRRPNEDEFCSRTFCLAREFLCYQP